MPTTAPIEIDFQTMGVREVLRAFDSIEGRAERAERTTTSSASAGARARTTATKSEAADREKAYQKMVAGLERDEKKATQAALAELSRRQKEALAAAERGIKDAEKAAQAKLKIDADYAKQSERIRETSIRMAHRAMEKEMADELRMKERAVQQEAALARRSRQSYGRSMLGAAGSSIGGTLGSIGTLAATTVGVGGGFAVASALRGEMAFNEATAQASNMSYIPGTTTREQVAPDKIAALARGVQGLTNIDKTEAANAIKRYVGLSSDFKGLSDVTDGQTGIEQLAVISKASGTDFGQLVEAAASIKAGNANMSGGQLMGTMRSLIGAGKLGTLPLDILASHIGEIQATAGRLAGGDTTEGLMANQAKLLGVAQLVGKATGGDAAEAATSIRHLTGDIAKHGPENGMSAAMIYKDGDPKKGMLAPDELLANVFKATGGRFDLEQKVLGERSIKVADALNPVFQAAEAKKKGSGVDAVRAEVQKFENVGYSKDDTALEFNAVMGTSGEKLSAAMKHFDEVIAGAATPAFEKFVKTLGDHQGDIEKVITGLGKLAEAFLDNPVPMILKAIAANVALDVGKAAIGKAIENKLMSTLGGVAAPGGSGAGAAMGFFGPAGASVGSKVMGTLGAAAGIGVLSVAIVSIGEAAIDAWAAAAKKDSQDAAGAQLTLAGAIGGATIGPDGKPRLYTDDERKKILAASLGGEEAKEKDLATRAKNLELNNKIDSTPERAEAAKRAHEADAKQLEFLQLIHRTLESIDRKSGAGTGAPGGPPSPVSRNTPINQRGVKPVAGT